MKRMAVADATPRRLDGRQLDVAIIGAGFAGLYALHRFRNVLGLQAESFDDAGGVGGTWYWNRYPGCRVDTEASVYCYSFDKELLRDWQWSERYPLQPEVLRYLNTVADKHDLNRSIHFNTRIVAAEWDGAARVWRIRTVRGEVISARFLIEGVGLLSSTHAPSFPGAEGFAGQIFHAARWPEHGVDLRGKRVGVIGTGSTGIQVVTALAREVDQLFVFQRTPQYVVPLGCGPFPAATRKRIETDPDEFYDWARDSAAVFALQESRIEAFSVGEAERQHIYEQAWQRGGGFAFMLETFSDIVTSEDANNTATDFIRSKIRATVKNPAIAERLSPSDLYAKRPLAVDGYYETYNRANVTLISTAEDPIVEIYEHGIRTRSTHVELDAITLATGFDAVTGNYLKIDTRGRGGAHLQDKWAAGPIAFGGLAIAGFPNLFTIFGPFGPFTSQPLVDEYQVNWISDLIAFALKNGHRTVEIAEPVEAQWVDRCRAGAEMTLFPRVDSWLNGGNIEGKPKASMFFMEGMATYMAELEKIVGSGYQEFRFGD
jgi:cation diffusion facilitator CzcD-associated flavoprotein CzcO